MQRSITILFSANIYVRAIFDQQFDCLELPLGNCTVQRGFSILSIQ